MYRKNRNLNLAFGSPSTKSCTRHELVYEIMSKTDWSKLKENGSPSYYSCVDGRIIIDEDTVVLFSKEEPNRIGEYYRSGNYSKIVIAEWRQSQGYGKFVYVLHEDKSSEYITNGGRGLIATPESGIIGEEFAQSEDYQNFSKSEPSHPKKGTEKTGKRKKQEKKQGPIARLFKTVKKTIKTRWRN